MERMHQDSPDAKKPCKGILKTSRSFDKPNASYRKSAKFDEINVLQTYHPPDKDYGHMKIDEPKTPYNYVDPEEGLNEQLDADLLAEKLRAAANTQTPSFGNDDLSDEEFPETDEERVRRMEFERRRKAHYNEYEAVRLARKLIQEELGDEDDEDGEAEHVPEAASSFCSKYTKSEPISSENVHGSADYSNICDDCDDTATSCSCKSKTIGRPMDVDQQE